MDNTMSNSFVFKSERPWPNARLGEGVIVGHTTATTAKIWIRAWQPGNFSLLCYPRASSGEATPDGEQGELGL